MINSYIIPSGILHIYIKTPEISLFLANNTSNRLIILVLRQPNKE